MGNSSADLIGEPQSLESILYNGVLSEVALSNLKSQSPNIVINIVTQHNKGNGLMDQRKIEGSFNNSVLKGNSAIQADNVIQSQNISENQIEKAFVDLIEDIKRLTDVQKKEQAEFYAELLKEAYEVKDKSKAKKIIGFLKESVGTVASLVTIAGFFGSTL